MKLSQNLLEKYNSLQSELVELCNNRLNKVFEQINSKQVVVGRIYNNDKKYRPYLINDLCKTERGIFVGFQHNDAPMYFSQLVENLSIDELIDILDINKMEIMDNEEYEKNYDKLYEIEWENIKFE
jgi:hypothetical protein